jgi:hypothetical protein
LLDPYGNRRSEGDQGANLLVTGLKRADLRGANLRGADLGGADLRGVNLREARGLAQEQVNQMIGDQETTLPEHLECPELWSTMSSEEQRQKLEEQQTQRRANAEA